MSRRKRSIITVTDQFCGAGGSSIGAVRAGLEVRMALNHWALAIETHNTNFPDTDHDCTDISACDPRRYPSTDILITSPECTTHSPAGGSRRRVQVDLFRETGLQPSDIRSRATAWDVVRFTEYHQYQVVICENVIEFTRWPLFQEWLAAMHKLGYLHRVVSLNSMFCHPTPQSRDRVYVVFWKKRNRVPDLNFTPPAFCPRCAKLVEAHQSWKNGRVVGKYRQQYVFTCPACRVEVAPYYFAALNALDFSLPAERIGDRARPLKPRTLERIQYGLDKYGRIALVIRTNMTTDAGRVRSIADAMHTQTASRLDALFSPPSFVVETAYHQDVAYRSRGVDEPLPPQTTQQSAALVSLPLRLGLVMPFIVSGQMNRRVYGSDDPLSTQAASRVHDGVVLPPTFFATLHGTSKAHAGDGPLGAVLAGGGHHGLVIIPQNDNAPRSGHEPLPGVSTRGGHAIIQGAALLTMRAHPELLFRTLDKALPAQVASGTQDWLLQRNPYLVSYYGTNNVSGSHEAVPTISTLDRHAVLEPTEELKVDDCYFRMLQPHEIKAAMAFPADYTVLGNKRDQVKQCGNAVTPPAEEWLIRRCVESLLPGKRRKAA